MIADFPHDHPPFGIEHESTRRMLATMCGEQLAQGLVKSPADPDALFAEFEAMRKAAA